MGKGRARRVSRYSNEFKFTAIKLASLPGTSAFGIALYRPEYKIQQERRQFHD